jgi:hypothetical protein
MITANRAHVREWRIHIGAHKTATTHIQNTLYRLRPILQQHGITFLPHDDLRARLGKVMQKSRWHYVLGNWSRQLILQRRILGQESAQDTVLLSEENILGGALDILATAPYQGVSKRLNFIRCLASHAPTTVFLSIRSFDRVLPGSYTTGLSNRPAEAIQAREILQTALGNWTPSWIGIIERIQEAIPNTPLCIWTQEDYRHHPKTILSALCGITIENLPHIPPSRSNLTPSLAAVEEIERLFHEEHGQTGSWKGTTKDICTSRPVAENNPRYTFLTDTQITRLQEQYRKDLEIITQRWPGMLIGTQ